LDRVVAYADGWIPYRDGTDQVTDSGSGDIEGFEPELASRIRVLQEKAAAAGRSQIPVTLFNPCPRRAALERYRQMGIDRLVFWLPTEGRAATLRTLDGLAALVGLGA
jgi:hypothetical protein